MFSLSAVVIGVWCSVLLVATGCSSPDPRSSAAADLYVEFPRSGKPTVPHVINRIGGDIVIVTGAANHVDADIDAVGHGQAPEAARIEAGSHIALINDETGLEVRPVQDANKNGPHPQDSVSLHAVVSPTTDLPDIVTHAGNIGIYGNVGKVTAAISERGNVEVRGADGNVNLSTQRGSIIADIMPGHDIMARAAEGSIDVHAGQALVSAATTNGNIRFHGTLRAGRTHQFTITGTGSIDVAVPPYPDANTSQQVYRVVAATSANPIIVEYPPRGVINGSEGPALPICGFIHSSGPYDYHVENTPAQMGRIEITPVVTRTYFFSGTLGTTYFRFDTNQTQVSFFTPITQSIHIYTAAQLNQMIVGKEPIAPECRAALDTPQPTAIVLDLKADRGRIYLHHIAVMH
jgi:hypothetical protein